MKENLKSIASRLGVSTSTVSRVLNGSAQKHRIAKRTADKINEEARRCGYTPSGIAQSLRRETTRSIGILIPSIDNLFFAKLASVLTSEIHRKGYFAIMMDLMENEKNFNDALIQLVSRNLDGIIVAPCGNNPALIEKLRSKGQHIVLVDRYYINSTIPYVSTNNYKGAVDAVNYLISKGHRNIFCIQGNAESSPNKERIRGYTDTMRSSGLEEYIHYSGNEFSTQNGYLETKMLLLQEERPTAIFSLSNNITLGSEKALREAGLKIGEDISILSFDSFIHMEYSDPPITRIAQPIEDMAMLATKLLFCEIEGESKENSHLELLPTLIEGESVADIHK